MAPDADWSAALNAAAAVLARPGAVVLLPTETVYGLVCRAGDPAGIERIYQLKGRDRSKPLALFAADYRDLAAIGVELDGPAGALAAKYCPGPITIVARSRTGGTVGFRVPDHPFTLALLRKIGAPLASTSANRSGEPNARSVAAALAMLDGGVDLAIDGGEISPDALASTVVDATENEPKVLRQGPIVLEKSDFRG